MTLKDAIRCVAVCEGHVWAYEIVGSTLVVGGSSWLMSIKMARQHGCRPRRIFAAYPGRVWRVEAETAR